jgi:hypothetical protein
MDDGITLTHALIAFATIICLALALSQFAH